MRLQFTVSLCLIVCYMGGMSFTSLAYANTENRAIEVIVDQQPYHNHKKASSTGLHGFSWFGFNNGDTMVDGLWSGSALSLDFATIVYRQQLLGFNAVRLPFSFKDLWQTTPRNFTQSCTMVSNTQVAESTLLAGESLPKNLPPQAFTPLRPNGRCNEYLPNDSTLNRFIWVVKFFTENGFTVLIDNHREDPTVLQNPNLWAQQWGQLAKALRHNTGIRKDRLIFDLLNEPDGFGLLWDGGNGKPALADLYLQAMDSIEAVAAGSNYVVEGCGQGALQANWGDGFCTDDQLIAQYNLSNPRSFFARLSSKSYAEKVGISPHVYGPAVTYNNNGSSGQALWQRLSDSFGTLNKTGYSNHIYPIVIGEFGSTFTQSNDIQTMVDLASYLNNSGSANDSRHNPITDWFYWAWNANSGDTGGLVANDWQTLETTKIAYLRTLGLTPFRY